MLCCKESTLGGGGVGLPLFHSVLYFLFDADYFFWRLCLFLAENVIRTKRYSAPSSKEINLADKGPLARAAAAHIVSD